MSLLPKGGRDRVMRYIKNGGFITLENYARREGWKTLGQGANGIVFNTGKNVRKFAAGNNRSEYNALKNLNGANYVPKALNINTGKGYTAYSMERLPPAKTLHEHGKTPKITAELKRNVMNMHNRGISHGDLHNGNILIDKTGKVWIIDFGRSIRISHGKTERESYKKLKKTNTNEWGMLYGPSTRYSRPNIRLVKGLTNFKRGLTTVNSIGRKVFVGPRGGHFRVSEKGTRIQVKGPGARTGPELNSRGRVIHTGPRGARYIIRSGKKVYKFSERLH